MKFLHKFFLGLFISFIPFSIYSYELVIATMFRNEGRYLKEWIEYHHMIGVEHFWMYNDRSDDDWEKVLAPYIESGLVEVFDWPVFHKGDYFGRQAEAFRDALYKGIGTAKWVACTDIDEFIVPLKDASLLECLNNHFAEAGAVYANWRCFGTGGITIGKDEPLLFKLLACSLRSHSSNCVGKSIYRPEAVKIDNLYYAHTAPLREGQKYLDGDGNETLAIEGTIIKPDTVHHAKFIQINHYVTRDEWYFQNVRLARARNGYEGYSLNNEALLLEQNRNFSLVKEMSIVNFIKKYYPKKVSFWEGCKDDKK